MLRVGYSGVRKLRDRDLQRAWQPLCVLLCLPTMLGSLINRFRIGILILACALALSVYPAANAAMIAGMQPVADAGTSSDHACPGCPEQHHDGMPSTCSAFGCWTVPGILPQTTPSGPLPGTAFAFPADMAARDAGVTPDPHPPRSGLRT